MGQVMVSYKENIAVVTIDNPPLNALSKDIVEDLGRAFDMIREKKVRAVIVTGAGPKAFVAGADISQFPSIDGNSGPDFVRHGQGVYRKISEFECPVICAVNGFALGGGCELALSCDIRVAAENAKFGLPEATLGILPGYGGTQRLPRLIGTGMAKKMIFTGEPVKAQEAYRMGLVEMVVPEGEALAEAMRLAERISSACAPEALKEIKKLINEGVQMPLHDAVELEAQAFGRLCDTEDKTEGVAAFFEKRKPAFQGR